MNIEPYKTSRSYRDLGIDVNHKHDRTFISDDAKDKGVGNIQRSHDYSCFDDIIIKESSVDDGI